MDVSEVIACWSSSSSFAGGHKASDIWSREESVGALDLSGRAYGFSVRCVQNLRLLFIFHAKPEDKALRQTNVAKLI